MPQKRIIPNLDIPDVLITAGRVVRSKFQRALSQPRASRPAGPKKQATGVDQNGARNLIDNDTPSSQQPATVAALAPAVAAGAHLPIQPYMNVKTPDLDDVDTFLPDDLKLPVAPPNSPVENSVAMPTTPINTLIAASPAESNIENGSSDDEIPPLEPLEERNSLSSEPTFEQVVQEPDALSAPTILVSPQHSAALLAAAEQPATPDGDQAAQTVQVSSEQDFDLVAASVQLEEIVSAHQNIPYFPPAETEHAQAHAAGAIQPISSWSCPPLFPLINGIAMAGLGLGVFLSMHKTSQPDLWFE